MSDEKPTYVEKWARRDEVYLEEGVMLLLDKEPFDVNSHIWSKAEGFDDMYETARRSIEAKTLDANKFVWQSPRTLAEHRVPRWQYRWKVTLPNLLAWAREKAYPIPEELEEAVNRFHPKTEDRPQGDADRPKWPSYETELLRLLARAAEKFWNNYDPSDLTTTAPSNKVVTGWLVEQGISERKAEVMAAILRPDGL